MNQKRLKCRGCGSSRFEDQPHIRLYKFCSTCMMKKVKSDKHVERVKSDRL